MSLTETIYCDRVNAIGGIHMKKISALFLALFLLCQTVSAAGYNFLTAEAYDMASSFSHGIARVVKNGEEAIINTDGAFVLPFDSRAKCIRKNGLIMVLGENDKAAFFSSDGVQLTEFIYDTYPEEQGKTGEKMYHYFHARYDGDGKSNLIPVSRDKKFGFLNPEGEEAIPLQFDYAYGFSDGIARIATGSEVSKYGTYINCKYGFIREDGSTVLPADTFWYIGDFSNGFAAGGNGPSEMIDKNGQIRELGGYVFESTNGIYITVRDGEGRSALLDMEGNTVVPFDWQRKAVYGDKIILDGRELMEKDGKVLYTAPEGGGLSVIWEDEVSPFIRVKVPAGDMEGHTLTGLIRTDGTLFLPPEYETVLVLGEGLIYAQTMAENMLFDYDGNFICYLNGNNPEVCREGKFVLRDFDTMKYVYVKNPLRDITVLYNGAPLSFDVPPLLKNSRTLVPLRVIFEALGAEVDWDDSTKTVYAKSGDTEIALPVGKGEFYKNGTPVSLDVPAIIDESRTLIPLRAAADAFGCEVDWDGETRTVLITK